MYAKPVILPPEVAIGALGKIQVSGLFSSLYNKKNEMIVESLDLQ